jgi:hypothetical protein
MNNVQLLIKMFFGRLRELTVSNPMDVLEIFISRSRSMGVNDSEENLIYSWMKIVLEYTDDKILRGHYSELMATLELKRNVYFQ